MPELFKKLKYKRSVKNAEKEFADFRKKEERLVDEWGFYDTNRKVKGYGARADSLMNELKSVRNSMKNSTTTLRQLKEKNEGAPVGTYKSKKKNKGWQNW